MNYETLTQHLAGFIPMSTAVTPTGVIDPERTTELILDSIGELCRRLAAVDGVDALALVVCKYATNAATPAEKATAEKAAEALATLIEHNEIINAFAEPVEMMAQASIKDTAKE